MLILFLLIVKKADVNDNRESCPYGSIGKLSLDRVFTSNNLHKSKTRGILSINDHMNLYLFDGQKLIKVDVQSFCTIDSLLLNINGCDNYNLLSSDKGIAVLAFNSSDQYDTTKSKHLLFVEFTEDFKEVRRSIFHTQKGYYLLSEDFEFISYYRDSTEGIVKYWFNQTMSYLTVVENSRWEADILASSYIDPITGRIYCSLVKDSSLFLKEGNNYRLLSHPACDQLKQFSVINDKIFFVENQAIKLLDVNDELFTVIYDKQINPVYRTVNHIFHLQEDTLLMWPPISFGAK